MPSASSRGDKESGSKTELQLSARARLVRALGLPSPRVEVALGSGG